MAPTISYTDSSGWAPPYTWDPANPMYVPAIFAHPTYLGARRPPAMTTHSFAKGALANVILDRMEVNAP